MNIKTGRIAGLLFGLLALPAALLSAPMISVDNPDFDMGTIHEGTVKSIKHSFKIKNTGDSALVIQKVKPG